METSTEGVMNKGIAAMLSELNVDECTTDGKLMEDIFTTPARWTEHTFSQTQQLNDGIRSPVTTATCVYIDLIMRIGVHGFLVVFGIVGNLLTMRVLWEERLKSATFYILFYLTVTDMAVLMLIGTLSLPTAILRAVGSDRQATKYYLNLLVYMTAPISTALKMSAWLTVMVTWHRYLSVCWPFKVKKYGSLRVAKIQVLVVFIGCFLVSIPFFFETKVVAIGGSVPGVRLQRLSFAQTHLYKTLFSVALNYAVVYIVPNVLLIIMTIALIIGLRNAKRKRTDMVSPASSTNDDLNISLIIVVVVFIICRMAGPLRNLVIALYPERGCGRVLFYYEQFSQMATLANSAVNFLIYMVCARRFRTKMAAVCRCWGNKVGPWYSTAAQTSGSNSSRYQGTVSKKLPSTRIIKI